MTEVTSVLGFIIKEIEDMYPTYEIARSTEYVVDRCKELADQLAQFSCIVK